MAPSEQGISVNKTNNPLKNHMEEGPFSLMRKVFREAAKSTHRNNVGSTLNLSFQDNSSYLARKKAIAIGKQEYHSVVSYKSYDPVHVGHTIRKQHSSGAVAPKKLGIARH